MEQALIIQHQVACTYACCSLGAEALKDSCMVEFEVGPMQGGAELRGCSSLSHVLAAHLTSPGTCLPGAVCRLPGGIDYPDAVQHAIAAVM